MKQLFDKLTEVQFTYQFVNRFYTVLKLSLNERVCTKKGQLFYNVGRTVNFNYHLEGVARMQFVPEERESCEETFLETQTPKKTNPIKTRLTKLL